MFKTLQNLWGKDIEQGGSYLNGEKLRFDFFYKEKISKESEIELEKEINKIIKENRYIYVKNIFFSEAKKQNVSKCFFSSVLYMKK